MQLVDDVAAIAAAMRGRRTLVVTGSGVAAAAGVPDHRGSDDPERPRVDFGDFVLDELWHRYLWWRNELSWSLLRRIAPTMGHRALARLEQEGLVIGIATQTVDRLHMAAGSRQVVELHGAFDTVVCLHCGVRLTRSHMSDLIREFNPGIAFPAPPPSDLEIVPVKDEAAARDCPIDVPPCPECGGMLKPDVVLLGEPLPTAAVRAASALAGACDVVLAVGTSRAVSSGMWVAMQAVENGARLLVINRGPTEADTLADLHVDADTDEALGVLADALLGGGW